MEHTRFSKTEAESLQGKRIRTSVDLADVPAGTPGQVRGWQEAGREGKYDLIVRFEPVLTSQPVLKWLSKSDYDSFVEEV